jgi:hypothetical protein
MTKTGRESKTSRASPNRKVERKRVGSKRIFTAETQSPQSSEYFLIKNRLSQRSLRLRGEISGLLFITEFRE